MYKLLIALLLPLIGIEILLVFVIFSPKRQSVQNVSSVTPTTPPSEFSPERLTLNKIFLNGHSWTATLSAKRVTTIIATGDVLLARAVNAKTIQEDNFRWPFENTADLLKQADITIINLETPLVENCLVTYSGMVFCGNTRNVDGLLFAGVDAVNLANNHMGNWGQDGVDTTVQTLSDAGIVPFGHINPVYYAFGDKTIAFLGYNDIGRQIGISHVEDELFEQEIKTANQRADIVIVSFHWGVEYTHQPSPRQIDIAHRSIDAGADLIIGNHPHWIQPAEIYNDGIVIYAHGNFIFDQMWSEKTRQGIVGRYTFYDDQLIDVEFIPIVIEDYGKARIADGEIKQEILEQFRKISLTL